MKKTLATLMGAIALILGLLSVTSSAQATTDDEGGHKWYVCKYVGTPGVDERLQTGQNPIFVDEHAIATYPNVAINDEFADAQGQSIVIDGPYDKNLDTEPGVESCPLPRGPAPVAPTVTQSDQCEVPGSVVLAPDTEGIKYTIVGPDANGDFTVTATAQDGLRLTASAGWVLSPDGSTATYAGNLAAPEDCPGNPAHYFLSTDKVDKTVDCDAKTVTTTTTTTTTEYIWNAETQRYDKQEPVVTVKTSVKDAPKSVCPVGHKPKPKPHTPRNLPRPNVPDQPRTVTNVPTVIDSGLAGNTSSTSSTPVSLGLLGGFALVASGIALFLRRRAA